MDKLMNPYRPGAGTTPPALAGRDQVIADFKVTLQRALHLKPSKSVMPIGLRGVGKTVLLNHFEKDAQALGFEVCSIEAPEDGNLKHLLAGQIRKSLYSLDTLANAKRTVSRAVSKALGVLKSFSLTLPDGMKLSLDMKPIRGEADSGNFTEDLTDLLVATGEAAREMGRGFLIQIDEIQYLEESEFAALITAIHKTTQKDLPIVLVGAGLPSVPGKVGEAKSYAERLFTFPSIGSLSLEDAIDAIAKPAADQGVMFQSAALEEIYLVTKGYPYFLQSWASEAWNYAPSSPITKQNIDFIKPIVQETLDNNFFLVRLERLKAAEKDYLRAMAELGPGPSRSSDIARQYGAKMESASPVRSGLIGKGMIYGPSHGETAFTVPLFDDFLRRKLPMKPTSRVY
jgi:hypothetical protein